MANHLTSAVWAAMMVGYIATAYDSNLYVDEGGNMHINTTATLYLNGVDLREWIDGCPLQPAAIQQPPKGLYFPGATFATAFTHMWRFDGTDLHPVPGILSNNINGLTQFGSKLVAIASTGRDQWSLQSFDGASWSVMAELTVASTETNCVVAALQKQLYVLCGDTRSGPTGEMVLRSWNGTSFTIVRALPSVLSPDMRVIDRHLFIFPGSVTVNDRPSRCFLQRFDGLTWVNSSSLGHSCDDSATKGYVPLGGSTAVLGLTSTMFESSQRIHLFSKIGYVKTATWGNAGHVDGVTTYNIGPIKAGGLLDGALYVVVDQTSDGVVGVYRMIANAFEAVTLGRNTLKASSFGSAFSRSTEFRPTS
eukprot:m.10861 g.10861  ORF g.10861 m.10861 type:complete len:364 (-) comp9695_c0_seq2:214-1305(-)